MKSFWKRFFIIGNILFGVVAVICVASGNADVSDYGILIGLGLDLIFWIELKRRKNIKIKGSAIQAPLFSVGADLVSARFLFHGVGAHKMIRCKRFS